MSERSAEKDALAQAWDQGAQAATDWIKDGAWLATMPDNPHRNPPGTLTSHPVEATP